MHGSARWWLGRPGWREDLHDAVAMARNSDPTTFAAVVNWTYGFAMVYGVLRADDAAVRVSEEAKHIAESSNWMALALAEATLGFALLTRGSAADRRRGLDLMMQFREVVRDRSPFLTPISEIWLARERAAHGDRDAAIPMMRQAVDELHRAEYLFYGVWGTGVLVETLLERGAEGDLAEAEDAIGRLTSLRDDHASGALDITLSRLHALLARAHCDEASYRDYRDRYRAMARSLGFEGHMQWAEAMP
jgi:ATP/maltotriose-dependent transcriptional regulator MalT